MSNLFTYSSETLEEMLSHYEKDFEWQSGIPIVIKDSKDFREYESTLESPEYRIEWEPSTEIENSYVLIDDSINHGLLLLPEDFIEMDIPELKEIVSSYKKGESTFNDVLNTYYQIFEDDTYVCALVDIVDEKLIEPNKNNKIEHEINDIFERFKEVYKNLSSEDKKLFLDALKKRMNTLSSSRHFYR